MNIKIDKSRDACQDNLVAAWISNNAKGTILAPTGFGKSRVALKIVSRMVDKNPDSKVILLVPTGELKKQWEEKGIPNMTVYTIQYLLVNPEVLYELEADLVIIDEIHRFAADEFSRCFDINSKKDYWLGLTATIERLDGREELLKELLPVVGTVTYEEAVAKDWIEPVKEFNLQVKMTKPEIAEYNRINKWFKHLHQFFMGDFNMAMACLKGGPEVATVAQENNCDSSTVRKNAMNWFRLMNERKEMLYASDSKLNVCIKIAEVLKGRKKIFFGQSAKFAGRLANKINAVEYHSNIQSREVLIMKEKVYKTEAGVLKAVDKVENATYEADGNEYILKWPKKEKWGPKKIKDYAIEALKEGKIDTICSAKALEVGLDIQDVEIAIIVSRSENPATYKQVRGRIGRKITEEGLGTKKPVLINLVYPDTRDEKWLEKAQEFKVHGVFDDVDELLEEVTDPVTFQSLVQEENEVN